MTDAMPDFDNMTQEQINEWMESLARRQGATEGFTTAASMAVPEIDPSSVDQSLLEDNYVPYGWSREDWNAYLQKEEAQKQSRAASAPPAPPAAVAPPPPPPAPASAPAAGHMMSEQELTEYILSLDLEQQMELLAEMGKSQRGEPNRLAELLPAWDTSTVDESKLGEYTPGYMSEEEWKAYQAKEAAAKTTAAPPPPISEPVADLGDVLKPPSLEDLLAPAAPTPSVADLFNEQEAALDEFEPLDTGALSGLFANQTSYEPSDIPQAPAATAALDDPIQWLNQLGGAAPETAALPTVSFEELNKNLVDLPQPVVDDDPLTWLSSLSELQPSTPEPIEDLDTGVFNLRNLSELAESVAAEEADASDEINWLESIARASGADQAELVTDANVPLPPPVMGSADGPGYQPYSFESAYPSDEPLAVTDEEASSEVAVPDVGSFDDPESWLDALASGVNAQREEALEAQAAASVDIPDDPMEVMRALNAGADVPPEAVETFFEKMFERAEQMPDEPEATDGDQPPIQAEIPDWLKESFASIDQDTMSDIPVAQMLEDLGLTEEEFNATSPLIDPQYAAPTPLDWQVEIHDAPDPAELDFNALVGIEDDAAPELTAAAIPAWILEQTGDLSGDMMDDIFADDENTVPIELEQRSLVVDTSDPWVQAFAKESDSPQELEAWYSSRVAQIGDGAPPARVEPAAALEPAAPVIGGLQAAQLPVEAVLEHATPVTVPAWLMDDAVETTPEPAPAQEWFPTEEEPIPSWLQSQVTEELAPSDPLPDWLAGADLTETEVPSWLLETVEEQPKFTPEPAVVIPPPPPVKPAPPPVVIERAAPPAPAPTRPAPVAAPPAEVAAHLEQARQQIASNVEVSLQHYEAVVRANAALNEVVQDLSRAVNDKTHKTNPAVYRVLGDALMRQGKLQDALSTYRKALNLLG